MQRGSAEEPCEIGDGGVAERGLAVDVFTKNKVVDSQNKVADYNNKVVDSQNKVVDWCIQTIKLSHKQLNCLYADDGQLSCPITIKL